MGATPSSSASWPMVKRSRPDLLGEPQRGTDDVGTSDRRGTSRTSRHHHGPSARARIDMRHSTCTRPVDAGVPCPAGNSRVRYENPTESASSCQIKHTGGLVRKMRWQARALASVVVVLALGTVGLAEHGAARGVGERSRGDGQADHDRLHLLGHGRGGFDLEERWQGVPGARRSPERPGRRQRPKDQRDHDRRPVVRRES